MCTQSWLLERMPDRRGDEEKRGRKGEAGETVEVKKGRKVAFYYW